ncbi:hypothetical protein DSO57_1000427 [Entomophthora muscae]|uniref:Uncharacterized protein n=1 Tax=Entomophthora muscae TaxID=34485 RepID=A0ACC2UJ14_9FUNG|nr:hypothetical protein DSO57_1000427 [Entomophthora muscae]
MQFSIQASLLLSLLGSSAAHMALSEPAPRRSTHHPGYTWENQDFDITNPLGEQFPFPCRGAPVGPVYKAYKAGSNIDIHIDGGAKHSGGHCQFSMTYDQVNFAVLKTVMGDCIISTVDYQVAIPKDAPNGNATFVWTWFNKIGNREMYMNCVDIEITDGSDNGSIKGKKMVVGNLPGYPTFPEGFADNYGEEMFESQPIITVAPKGSPSKPRPTQRPKPTPTVPKPTQTPTKPTSKPPQAPTKPDLSGRCSQGARICRDTSTIGLCWNYFYSYRACPKGTHCKAFSGTARCE